MLRERWEEKGESGKEARKGEGEAWERKLGTTGRREYLINQYPRRISDVAASVIER